MVRKKKPPSTPAFRKRDPNALRVEQQETESREDALAHAALRPQVQAAVTLTHLQRDLGEVSVSALVDDLTTQCSIASQGDLTRAEALLTAQAHTLDALFNSLARRATLNMGEYMKAAETYLRLALKAQSQCRATLETLAVIKNPPPFAVVRQANIAHGPQQVNNGAMQPGEPPRARKTKIEKSKLLEAQNGDWLDCRATSTASKTNSELAALGKRDRAENGSGQSPCISKRL